MTYWNLMVVSPIEEDYHNHIALLEKQFCGYPEALHYVKSNWLDTYRVGLLQPGQTKLCIWGPQRRIGMVCLLFFICLFHLQLSLIDCYLL